MMKKIHITVILASIGGTLVFGQSHTDQKIGMTGADFLSIPVGARAAALGDAYVAMADGPSAMFWNPAGIVTTERFGVFTSVNQWMVGIAMSAAAVTLNVSGIGSVGFSYQSMASGEMRVRTPFRPDGTGEMFKAGGIALGTTWARSLTDRFALGLSIKYIREEYYNITSQGWAVDIGSIYQTGWRGMNIGMAVTNFGPDIAFDGTYAKWSDLEEPGRITDYEEYPLPMTFRFGLTLNLMELDAVGGSLVLLTDAVHPPDNSEFYNVGIEATMLGGISARAGYRLGVDAGGLCAGAGYNLPLVDASIDVAYSDYGDIGSATRASVGFNF